jgi:alpha,alpha-trehalase
VGRGRNNADPTTLTPEDLEVGMVRDRRLPAAPAHWPRIRHRLQGRRPLLFLSYDGALAPLVSREDMAVLSRGMKEVLRQLAGLCPTVIVSRRGRQDLASMVDIDGLFHAGSDGLDFSGPGLSGRSRTKTEWVLQIRSLAADLVQAYLGTNGVLVDPRDITLRLHLDPVVRADSDEVERVLDSVLRGYPQLWKMRGRDGLQVRPRLEWDRGRAATRIAAELAPPGSGRIPVYAGTHPADETAFHALREKGLSLVVGGGDSATEAHYQLQHPDELESFLYCLLDHLQGTAGGLRREH